MTKHIAALVVVLLVSLLSCVRPAAAAQIEILAVAYESDGVALEGYLARPSDADGPRPGVLVVHAWWGLDDETKRRARELAEMGYVAFACDMYGADAPTDAVPEAQRRAAPFYEDRALFKERARAGLDVLRRQDGVDPQRLGAIGYCFGGAAVLELARSGADVDAVVSFHGNLRTPHPEDARNIRASVMVCNGSQDAFVPFEERREFIERMNAAHVDFVFVEYSGAVHSFTNPTADERNMNNVAYDETADRRSWGHMKLFFEEKLGGPR